MLPRAIRAPTETPYWRTNSMVTEKGFVAKVWAPLSEPVRGRQDTNTWLCSQLLSNSSASTDAAVLPMHGRLVIAAIVSLVIIGFGTTLDNERGE